MFVTKIKIVHKMQQSSIYFVNALEGGGKEQLAVLGNSSRTIYLFCTMFSMLNWGKEVADCVKI